MSFAVSPQIKIVALVGLLAAAALAAGTMVLGRSSTTSSSVATPVVVHHVAPKHHAAPAPVHKARAVAPVHKAAPATKPAPAPARKPAVARTVAPNGLPVSLAALLKRHPLVVVALYDPEVQTDAWALREARAGAADAGAGFLAVNVLDDKVAGPLTASAGNGTVLPAPGLLVYKAPDTVMKRVDGFVDRAGVAAVTADAATATPPAPAPAPALPPTTTP